MAPTATEPVTDPETTSFFYGTLMAPAVLQRVTSKPMSSLRICPAILPKHRRYRVREADYPALVPFKHGTPVGHVSNGNHGVGDITNSSDKQNKEPTKEEEAEVRGTYVAGLSRQDFARLDVFEGDEYERRRVKVRLLEYGVQAAPENANARVSYVASVPVAQSETDLQNGNLTNGSYQREAAGHEYNGDVKDDTVEVETQTYIWRSPLSELELDQEWDFDEFVKEKLWRWAGGAKQQDEDQGFRDVIEMEQGTDPTRGRGVI